MIFLETCFPFIRSTTDTPFPFLSLPMDTGFSKLKTLLAQKTERVKLDESQPWNLHSRSKLNLLFLSQAIDASKIHINDTSSETVANSSPTGGSTGESILLCVLKIYCALNILRITYFYKGTLLEY